MITSVLIILIVIIAYARNVEAGYCTKSYPCSYQSFKAEIQFGFVRLVLVTKYKTCYRRICCPGYNGPYCAQAICYGSTSCPNGGTCSSPDICSCRLGFGGSGCKDINECLVGNGGCQHICKNSFGSHQCNCKNGFYLARDGKSCVDINECAKNNGECNQNCRNVDGSYNCFCMDGFKLAKDGKMCEDINECAKNNGECNQNCRNVDGSYKCFCMDGFKLAKDGKMCEDINECLVITCLNNGNCVNTAGSYLCQCNQGFAGDLCQSDINECLLSNGTCDDQCINTNGSFYCQCNGGSSSLSGDGVSCIVHVTEKSYNSVAVGLGTSISLAFVVVGVLFVAILKARHKRLSTPKDTQPTSQRYQSTQIETSGVRTIYNNLYGNYENVLKPEESENNRSISMNEYESVVVKEVAKVDGETVGHTSLYDNIQTKGLFEHDGQQRPDRETAEYENLVIFRK